MSALPSASAAPAAPPALAAETPMGYLPVSLFGAVMGLTGLSVAWQIAHARFGVTERVSHGIGVVAVIAFALMATAYAVKLVGSPKAVRAEFAHPTASNMFGTPLISLLLLPIVLAPVDLVLARVVWAVGAAAMLVFSWLMIDRWMSDRQQAAHATPAWLVPVVGLLDVPLALPALQWTELHGLMVLGLAVGLFFAVPLFTLVFSRLLFEPPLPDALQPTLMILLAPFAVGTSTYVATRGEVDLFAEVLFALTLFMLTVLVGRLRYLGRCCPFRVTWWAVSFPLAAAATAALRIDQARPVAGMDAIAIVLLAFATVVASWLLVRTVVGIARGELRALSGG